MDSKRAPDIYYERVSFLSDLLQETELTPPATECTPCHLELCILQHSDKTTSIRNNSGRTQYRNPIYTILTHATVHVHTEGGRKRPIKFGKMILTSGGKALDLGITTLSSSLFLKLLTYTVVFSIMTNI